MNEALLAAFWDEKEKISTGLVPFPAKSRIAAWIAGNSFRHPIKSTKLLRELGMPKDREGAKFRALLASGPATYAGGAAYGLHSLLSDD